MARRARTNNELLTMALVGGEAEIAKIDAAIREIQAQLGHRGPGRPRATPDGTAPRKRTMSAAARRRIGAAQRKRWAALKKAQTRAAAPKKRKLSAAGRRAIRAATRKRWAAVHKAAAKKTKTAVKAAKKPATAAAS